MQLKYDRQDCISYSTLPYDGMSGGDSVNVSCPSSRQLRDITASLTFLPAPFRHWYNRACALVLWPRKCCIWTLHKAPMSRRCRHSEMYYRDLLMPASFYNHDPISIFTCAMIVDSVSFKHRLHYYWNCVKVTCQRMGKCDISVCFEALTLSWGIPTRQWHSRWIQRYHINTL